MNIFTRVTLRNLGKNRIRTIVTIVGILLSAAMFTAVTTSLVSLQDYLIRCAQYTSGDYHGRFDEMPAGEMAELSGDSLVEKSFFAQNLGYAERNPEADVEGHDTCRKIAILTAMATGRQVNYEEIYTEGITGITEADFKYAQKMEASIKLFGTSRILGDGRVSAYVAPVMVGKSHPLYPVSDVFNGILVRGNMVGDTMFYGSGAGKLPTASAVVADLIEAAQNLDQNVDMGWGDEKQEILPMEQASFRYFLRLAGSHRNKEQDVQMCFGQTEVIELYGMDEFGILTRTLKEGEFRAACGRYESLEKEKGEYGIKQTIRALM